ncbi:MULTISPECIES: 50S ribosomal protein L25/general stress protein Ctc [Micrococcaceae]|uniref:50S ribosomal protein L25/general stress protein Ctc n=1 Tax=unclassified Kocuria TaxID=2649579 RepID=UPI0010128653|nr:MULTISPECIES: 50S ribosomal protein L25/general stress protein Ctc [unclassified Kocuria]
MADRTKISAESRDEFGKGAARRIRRADKIPAVIYGHGEDPIHIVLPGHATMMAARNPNAVLSLDIEGKSHLAMIKDIQRHSIRPEIYHVDLLTVRRGERVEVEIPVTVEGEVAPGNLWTQPEQVVVVDADALDVPEEVLVDLAGRGDGEHVTAADLELPEGVNLVSEEDLIIVNISEEVEQDLGEEPEEGAEAEEGEGSSEEESSEEDSE